MSAARWIGGAGLSVFEVTGKLAPGPGQDLVPVALKPSALPVSGLAPGDDVLAVPVPASGSSGSVPVISTPVAAVVEAVSPDAEPDGLDVVDLLVASDSGPSLAQQAAAGQVALVVTKRSGP